MYLYQLFKINKKLYTLLLSYFPTNLLTSQAQLTITPKFFLILENDPKIIISDHKINSFETL